MTPQNWRFQSEIKRWAKGYWMSAYNASNLITLLSGYRAYFDASRDDADTVVGGYLSTVEEWEQFEISWKLTLAKYHVPYFHMKEFTGCQKAYKHSKWKSEPYRAQFISELAQIIRGWTYVNIASGMKQELFDHYNKVYKLDERFNPYAICGRDCAAHARRYIREELKSELPFAFIFDRGDEGRGFLMKEMELCKYPSPEFRRSRPDPKDPQVDKDDPFHVQLQACDLVAWEIRRGDRDVLLHGKRGKQLRTSLRVLAGMKHLWKETKELDLEGLIQVAKIEKR